MTLERILNHRYLRPAIGLLIVGIAVFSLIYTAQFSERHAAYIQCAVQAFKTRDNAQLRLNTSLDRMSEVRHTAIRSLFAAAEGQPVNLTPIRDDYEVAYQNYINDLVIFREATQRALIPTGEGCQKEES